MIRKTKFSPGPRETGDSDWHTIVAANTRYNSMPSTCGVAKIERSVDESEDLANARLIASAPTLLAALVALHDDVAEYIKINNLGNTHHNRVMQDARDAIWLAIS